MKTSITEKAELFQVEELQERLEFSGWTTGIEGSVTTDNAGRTSGTVKVSASKAW